MSKVCMVCGRSALSSATRSHSNVQHKRKQNVNLQSKKLGGLKLKVCTKCLKTFNKAE
ncbi:MAG TPA: 50S ribosomal protein L28 [bacterium]|nr:50S ribosomal protein L28 [bacterium]HPL93269.1 50S ribosomal protein L28 [bacterium]